MNLSVNVSHCFMNLNKDGNENIFKYIIIKKKCFYILGNEKSSNFSPFPKSEKNLILFQQVEKFEIIILIK